MTLSKIDQKYKGVRRIMRRLIPTKKTQTKYPIDHVHKKKNNIKDSSNVLNGRGYPQFKEYTY